MYPDNKHLVFEVVNFNLRLEIERFLVTLSLLKKVKVCTAVFLVSIFLLYPSLSIPRMHIQMKAIPSKMCRFYFISLSLSLSVNSVNYAKCKI